MKNKEVYYSDYLQLEKVLNAQDPESVKIGLPAHDEMLFIIVHQAYELWFKQIMHEMVSVRDIFAQPEINDDAPDMQIAVHRMKRVVTILRVLVQQINIIETMTPLDFLDFRNLLRPASGFQSYQFKMLEALLGLKMDERFGKQYYLKQLRQEDIQKIRDIEAKTSLIEHINSWLERMPFFDDDDYWKNFKSKEGTSKNKLHQFWSTYRSIYAGSLVTGEETIIDHFNEVFHKRKNDSLRRLSPRANRNALFIMLYRDYPLLQNPFELLNILLEIDELMATWRYRHMNMVHRMIGTRVGTGGSSGKDYLKSALDQHYVFKEIAELTSYIIERRKLPVLSRELQHKLGFEDD